MTAKKTFRKLLAVLVTMTLLLGSASVFAMAEGGAPYLEKANMTIKIGQLASVKVVDVPAGATVTFKSTNKKVVTVSKGGKLTPKKKGKAVVKATVKGGGQNVTLKCKIKVQPAIVAVIDGGAAKNQKVWKAVGASGAGKYGPANGHAKRQIDNIKSKAPKAKILSIKVTDKADQYISTTAVEKALKIAKKYKASVVYYSFYGPEPSDEEYELVADLIASGVRVVGPAGNDNGKDARELAWLTNMEGATCVGAWGNGKILPRSNKHANVYVKAGSTSAAAAYYAGMLANGKLSGVHKGK